MSFVIASGKGLDLTEVQALNGGSVNESREYVIDHRPCAACSAPIAQWRHKTKPHPEWLPLRLCSACLGARLRSRTGKVITPHQ